MSATHLLLVFGSLKSGDARSWRDIPQIHDHAALDTGALLYLQQQKIFLVSQFDAYLAPSLGPSRHPTKSPTLLVIDSPTETPTMDSTPSPTIAATVDPFKDSKPPDDPDDWYFNYDGLSPYGPGGGVSLVQSASTGLFETHVEENHWGQVSRPPNDYWNEFVDDGFGPWRGTLQVHEPSENRCATGQLQSPIDVRENGAVCRERHQIRHLQGDFPVKGYHVQKSIESNKLRLTFERRPCNNTELDKCMEPDPPHADFPNGWGGFADLLHIDIKVPSEHSLRDERFDGELQYFHIHPGRRRLAALSILIRASDSGYNYYFQEAIDAFRDVYNENKANCRRRVLEQRNRTAKETRVLANDYVTPYNDYLSWAKSFRAKETFEDKVWDPYHEMLVPTIHFYRYDGSLTEPPCGEFVSWWIADTPMTISFVQLDQLKRLLFTNVDYNCERTTVQFLQSVARPIQKSNNRPVWRCTAKEFGPDP